MCRDRYVHVREESGQEAAKKTHKDVSQEPIPCYHHGCLSYGRLFMLNTSSPQESSACLDELEIVHAMDHAA